VALSVEGCASSEAGSPDGFFEAPQLVKDDGGCGMTWKRRQLIGAQGTRGPKWGAMRCRPKRWRHCR